MSRILFMGTPDFARESLKALVEAGHDVIGVVTKVDKQKGRGMKMIATPVKEYALEQGLSIYQPEKIRDNDVFYNEIKNLNPDIIVVVAYGKILPKEILDLPKLGCINVHGSLLPKYRGAAPIQWAVLNGDKTTGVTTIYMDEGMDTGDMILKEEVEIGENETTGELWNRLAVIGANLLIKTIQRIENNVVVREKQTGECTYAPMLTKDLGQIKWQKYNSCKIKNLVRGLNPIMGAYSFLNEKKYKFWSVHVLDINELDELKNLVSINELLPGTVVLSDSKKGLYIKTIDGIISVLEIQAENSKKMNIFDFLRGNKIDKLVTFM